ncbi:P-loop NTPase family protein [Litchfieldia alkalitelluris]|uniref:hypothetical protein n=1 Tax=Litchfieldia alkalitelluris TaxID=304268 RepID=UPI000996608D|nr:hypothetical protein [Litchfieldia alkalitelluris]
MIKSGASKEVVASYIKQLATAIELLNPVLIYIEQDDLKASFTKAVKERPKEWSEGFIYYYTSQGYGYEHGFNGLEGTIKVLEERLALEQEIYNSLNMNKYKVNNMRYETERYQEQLNDILGRPQS